MRKGIIAGLAVLLAGVAIIYSQTHDFGLLSYDDEGYTTDCPFVKGGLSAANVASAFKDPAWGGIYMPVTYVSYMAVITLAGPDSAGAQHVTNAVCHGVNAALFFVFLLLLFRDENRSPRTTRRLVVLACAGAALWAWHALRVESVAWVASRKDALFTFFTLLGLMAWRRAGDSVRYLVAAYLAMLLGCLSKPTAMVFPALALSLDILDGRVRHRRILAYLPLVVLALATAGLATYSQTHGTGEASHPLFMASFAWRCLNAVVSLGLYAYHFAVPYGLQFWYRPVRDGIPLHMTLGLVSFALACAVVVVAWWRLRTHRRLLAACLLWLVAAISPTLGIAGSFGNHAFADRFTYLPAMALSVLAVGVLSHLTWRRRGTVCAALALAAVWLLVPACWYCSTYRTNLTAFTNVARFDPGHCYAWAEIGSATIINGDLDKGIEFLRRSVRLLPTDDARDELVFALASRNDPKDEAEVVDLCMRDAGPITPDGKIPVIPVEKDRGGMKCEALGVIATRHHDWANAVRCFKPAWERGRREDCRMRLAMCYWNMKRRAEAVPHLVELAQSTRPDIAAKARELLAAAGQ